MDIDTLMTAQTDEEYWLMLAARKPRTRPASDNPSDNPNEDKEETRNGFSDA